ncbi:MAG: hypothetical protein JXA25_00765 [Anaerolineales bacterium]|nr:hypothetical protein [Anaerolineales bacterium]
MEEFGTVVHTVSASVYDHEGSMIAVMSISGSAIRMTDEVLPPIT